jgi:galactokinase/mevalonate kinase-like predicted kinase
MDEELTQEPTVLAHRLCGAGNGGFFLTFSEKDSLRIPYDNVKINLVSDGVRGESI